LRLTSPERLEVELRAFGGKLSAELAYRKKVVGATSNSYSVGLTDTTYELFGLLWRQVDLQEIR